MQARPFAVLWNIDMQIEKQHACHGGTITYYSHDSEILHCTMRFSVFMPPAEVCSGANVTFLSGLTCTEDNFTTKGNAYATAAQLGLTIIAPDTSPRGDGIPNDDASDLGQGAGFYIDAVQEPWAKNFQMEHYLMKELLPACIDAFDLNADTHSIMGHSMGGHGALTLYFKYPESFRSCSAFSPIVAPTQVPWGRKAFTAYLGDDENEWKKHDATELVAQADNAASNAAILIDQGLADDFLEAQLKPELFEAACLQAGQKLTLRMQKGYDHSYFFIHSFMADHLEWHHAAHNA